MLPHHQAHRRQLTHLPPLGEHDGRRLIQRHLTLRADRGAMFHHLVRGRDQGQRLAAVPQLPARLLATPPAVAARTLAPQRIARGRFVAVMAILRQSRFQLLHTLAQRRDLLPLARSLGFEAGDFFLWRHAPILRPQCKSACTVPVVPR
jgi:hypothetical protein